MAHAANGNSVQSPSKTRSAAASISHGKHTQLNNLIPQPKAPLVADKENRSPHFFNNPDRNRKSSKKKRRSSHEADPDWQPPAAKRHKRVISTSSISTQTQASSFQLLGQVSHSDMLSLQLGGGFSDRQMKLIASTFRASTKVTRLIEPNYEPFLQQLHQLFTDLYAVTDYQPPGDAPSIPVVYCTDTAALLQRLQVLHQRDVKIVNHGADAGM